jgi:branched-chain amino acid transport system ATP-binding protein
LAKNEMGDMETVLEARGLTRRFGGLVAVDNVDLAVTRGTTHSIIGPNGAGKTTFFNLLTKFITPSAGSIRLGGKEITCLRPADIARLGVVRSFQISAVFPELTAMENVRFALQRRRGGSFDFWRAKKVLNAFNEKAEELLATVGLERFASTPASELPYGRKRTLELATTLALDPQVMLLDEPMAGMGREDVKRIAQLLKKVRGNRTILMVEHNLSVVAELSDRITVFARGRIISDGSYEKVSKDPAVIEAYIGSGHG